MSIMIPDYLIDLRRGIESEEIVPYYQPLMELRTGQLIGFEVLARWKHPIRGMVPPDEFIRLAEEAGYIGRLMEKVLEHAFRTMWRLPEHLRLSVNVSAIQLRDHALCRQVSLAAEEANFSLDRLTVEITESALVGNIEHARSITEELKSLGVRIAIDDFGTGYSSLRHLHALPFDEIKVDRTFVQTMLSRRESRKIVAAIIGLGQSLGLTTVAEGVEDDAQADMLLWLGCDLAQGFLYSKPISDQRLERFVKEQKMARRESSKPPNQEDGVFPMEALPGQRLSQLQAIYDGVPVGLCFIDRNERYVSLNKRLAEMNHAPIAAHLGRTVAEMSPGFYMLLEPYIKRALEGEAFSGLEFEAAVGDGEVQTRSTSYQPTRDEAGEIVGVSVAVVDITERENANAARRESEDHHRHAIEQSQQVLWTADPEGLITEASAQWTLLTGLSQEESLNWGWVKALHPNDIENTAAAWMHAIGTGEPVDVQYRVLSGGKWRWMRARGSARRRPDGKIMRWYGTLEDIDDYRRATDKLEDYAASRRAVFEAVPAGMLIVEAPSGRVLAANARAEAILGSVIREDDRIIAHERWSIFHPDESQVDFSDHPVMRAIFHQEKIGPEEFLYRHDDGVTIAITLTAVPIRRAEGEISGVVLTIVETANQGVHSPSKISKSAVVQNL